MSIQSPLWREELKRICKILKDNGVDLQKIPTRISISPGQRIYTKLKDVHIDGIDLSKIIEENELDEEYPIGSLIKNFRNAYTGTSGNMSKEEREEAEELGIVKKRDEKASAPIFKGGKLSQFHLNFISSILDKMLTGDINTKEAVELLKQASIENNETIIEDRGGIIRGVEILLKDKPEEIEKFHKIVKKNSGRRVNREIDRKKIGLYHERKEKFEKDIIEIYLPLILNGEITFAEIEVLQKTSHQTINQIIEDHYNSIGDTNGLEEYKKCKKEHSGGASKEARINAKATREEVKNYSIVDNRTFLLLSPEDQHKQLVMKIRKLQLEAELSETNKSTTAITSIQTTEKNIKAILDYFKGKNEPDKTYFTDEDIRYMIYRYPTIIGRNAQTLDEKLNVLTSYDEIDTKKAYAMLKEFPAILGYDSSRTKKQLDLLQEEDLIDAVTSMPRRFMLSVKLMYALIQYAKERNHTSDLSGVKLSNIFMANSRIKRLYGSSYDKIKTRYPYKEKGKEIKNTTTSKNIALIALKGIEKEGIEKAGEADDILKQALEKQNKIIE